MEKELFDFSKEDESLFRRYPVAVYVRNHSVELSKYISMMYSGKPINCSFPMAEYRSVAELLLDFLQGDKWYHNVTTEQMKSIKEMLHRIYIEPRFPTRSPSVRYQNEIARRKAHLYDVVRIKPPIAADIFETIEKKISKMKSEGKTIPELPDRHTAEGLEKCIEILKIRMPKEEGFQFFKADDLIFWALEKTAKEDLVIATCKECGQLFVKERNECCSRRCADLNKIDCGRFCGDKEIESLYQSIYKALDKTGGKKAEKYVYSGPVLTQFKNQDELFSDLASKYEAFVYTSHEFSESDFEIMKETFLKKIYAPKYESFKAVYRRYKIKELTDDEYTFLRSEFLDWLRDVKSFVSDFVRKKTKLQLHNS